MIRRNALTIIKFLRPLIYTAGFLALAFLLYKQWQIIAPFIIAYILSCIIEPIIRIITKNTRIPRKVASGFVLLFVLSSFGFIIFKLSSKLLVEIKAFSITLPVFFNNTYKEVATILDKISSAYYNLPEEVTSNLTIFTSDLASKFNIEKLILNFLKPVINLISGLSNIPNAVIFIFVTILSTYFLSSDRDKILETLKCHLPDTWIKNLSTIKNDIIFAFFGYLKAQLILMSITFTELCIGFYIMKFSYCILLAFIISIVDSLPVLGAGCILLPMAIYHFIIGNIRMGLSLIILYGIVLIIRQITEPKILGSQIGIHPLLTLSAIYLGLNLFGIGGMILGPVGLILSKSLITAIFKGRTFKEVLSRLI